MERRGWTWLWLLNGRVAMVLDATERFYVVHYLWPQGRLIVINGTEVMRGAATLRPAVGGNQQQGHRRADKQQDKDAGDVETHPHQLFYREGQVCRRRVLQSHIVQIFLVTIVPLDAFRFVPEATAANQPLERNGKICFASLVYLTGVECSRKTIERLSIGEATILSAWRMMSSSKSQASLDRRWGDDRRIGFSSSNSGSFSIIPN